MLANKSLWLDLETRSTVSIKKGHHRYAEESEIILMAYAIGDEDPHVYDSLHDWCIPDDLEEAMTDPEYVIRTHGEFDRVLMSYHGWDFPPERHECVMALARSNSLPGGLDKLCNIFNIPPELAKIGEGKDLVRFFCMPKKKGGFNNPKEHVEKWEEFKNYAGNDITAMREVYKHLPRHNFELDKECRIIYAKINDRGFKADLELTNAAIEAVAYELELSKVATADITQEEVASVTQTAVLLEYIREKTGKFVNDLKGSTVTALIKDGDLPNGVLELLELRQNICKSSTAKYKRVSECVCKDGMLRGTMVFNGALRTRRNTGAIFQPLNLPRPTIKGQDLEEGIELLKWGMGYVGRNSIMPLCSSALRGVIVPEKGHKLVVSDYANIEGRIAAWRCGEEWKVQAFRDFDNGTGKDLYKLAYAKAMGVPVDGVNDDDQRTIGKIMELSLGYGGGVPAFMIFALNYGVNLYEMAKNLSIANHLAWEKAHKSYEYAVKSKRLVGLDEFTYKRLAYLVQSWRLAHPRIVSRWYEIDKKCRQAIQYGLEENKSRHPSDISPWVEDRFLIYPLPSGQRLMYLDPKVDDTGIKFTDGRFGETRTWGSKIFENDIQSTSKDILLNAIPKCMKEGYSVIISLYDELVCQTPDSPSYNSDKLSEIMTRKAEWYEDLPITAKGYESYRFKKG